MSNRKPTEAAATLAATEASNVNEITQNRLEVAPNIKDENGLNMIDFLIKAQAAALSLDHYVEAVRLNVEYLEFQGKGEQVRGIFMGYGKATMKNKANGEYKELKTVILQTAEGVKIHAGVNLLNTFEGANLPIGAPVSVIYARDEKTDTGNVKIYEVNLLAPKS